MMHFIRREGCGRRHDHPGQDHHFPGEPASARSLELKQSKAGWVGKKQQATCWLLDRLAGFSWRIFS
jgi:hypothetical protein